MKYNVQIIITRHATERYLQRFTHSIHTGNDEEDRRVAERYLQEQWSVARYISDDSEGILFRSDGIDMIVKGCRMVTVMTPNKTRHRNFGRSTDKVINGNKDGMHIPPQLRTDKQLHRY